MATTLTLDGVPEGDEPNTVVVKYTVPSDTSAAWETATFTVISEGVDAGDEIISTTLDLPGVYRIEEASNKAVQKLRRANNRLKISFVTSDEGVIFQPGDLIQLVDSARSVNINVWVESCMMIDYGRYRVSGMIYRDPQFPTDCWQDIEVGTWVTYGDDPVGSPAVTPGPPVIYIDCNEYACNAIEATATAYGLNHFPLFDPTYSNTIPTTVRTSGTTDFDLYPDQAGNSFGTYGHGASALGSNDITTCLDYPTVYGWKNTYNAAAPARNDRLSVSPIPAYLIDTPQIDTVVNFEVGFVLQNGSSIAVSETASLNLAFDIRYEMTAYNTHPDATPSVNRTIYHKLGISEFDSGSGQQPRICLSGFAYGGVTPNCFVEMPSGYYSTPTYVHAKAKATNFRWEYNGSAVNGRQLWLIKHDLVYYVRAVKSDGEAFESTQTYTGQGIYQCWSTSASSIEQEPIWTPGGTNYIRMFELPRNVYGFYGLTTNDGVNAESSATWDAMELAFLRNYSTYVDPNC